jgi:hypothetical protein
VDLFRNVGPSKDHWLSAGSGLGGVHYDMIFGKEEVRVQFVLNRIREQNKVLFDALHDKKDQIELAFGDPFDWRRLDAKNVSIISFAKTFDGYNRDNWPEMIEWLTDHVRKIEATFGPEIPGLRQLLRAQFSRDAGA